MVKNCQVDQCGFKHYAKGFCKKHYQRFMTYGSATVVHPNQYKDRPTCSKGHRYTEDNTLFVNERRNGSVKIRRRCRVCLEAQLLRAKAKRYSLTVEQLSDMLSQQDNRCKICDVDFSTLKPRQIHIDHDHTCCEQGSCGQCVRGVVCNGCNIKIGVIEIALKVGIFKKLLAHCQTDFNSVS